MPLLPRPFVALTATCLIFAFATQAMAQSAETKAPEQNQPAQGDATKDAAKKVDDFAEAARLLTGPAGNPECVWLGRRVVSLLWRDDLDTAFRHLDLYDRFGCPSSHIQTTFRCIVRQGNIDPKANDTLNARVHSCWINPTQPSTAAAAPAAPAASTAPNTPPNNANP